MKIKAKETGLVYEVDLTTSKRYNCPDESCTGDSKSFAWKGEVGYCHRCGTSFYSLNGSPSKTREKDDTYSITPGSIVKQTLNKKGDLMIALEERFSIEDIMDRYFIGCTQDGRTIFWQVDNGHPARTRLGKVMKFNGLNRDHSSPPMPTYTLMNQKDYKPRACFFGQHQLLDIGPGTPVNIVESEKTAIIASIYLPDEIWLATGGKSNLKGLLQRERLGERHLYLYPDLDAVKDWERVSRELATIRTSVVDWEADFWCNVEEIEVLKGKNPKADIADFLVNQIPARIQFDYTIRNN